MSNVWLIAKREFRTRALSKANIISSIVMLVVIVAAALVLKPFLSAADDAAEVVYVDGATVGELIPFLETTALQMQLAMEFEAVEAPAEPEVAEGSIALVVGSPQQPEIYLESERADVLELVGAAVSAFVLDDHITSLGGDTQEVSDALAQAVPTVTILGEVNEFDLATFVAGMVVIFIMFFVLIQSSSVIMMGVVEEKASRVVEILLATVRPAVLLGGKILGVGLYSLSQAVTMLAPILFAAWYLDFLGYVDVGIGALLVNFGLWFVLGFAIFTILFGGLAALVSRQEDIGSVSTPMMILMMVPLYLGIYLVPANPDGTITKVLTQIPFFAPFMVPMRTAFGAIEPWETVLAVAICLITIPLLTWLAGRIYAGAVLNTGGRMKMRDALRRS